MSLPAERQLDHCTINVIIIMKLVFSRVKSLTILVTVLEQILPLLKKYKAKGIKPWMHECQGQGVKRSKDRNRR